MPRKTRLGNGVILLTKPSDHNDIVAVRAAFSCGSRSDPLGRSGVTSLTFSLLLKDTLTRSAAEVADYLESVGGSIAESVRKDLAGISVACTSEGLPTAVEVLTDAIRSPAFLPAKVDLEKHNLLMAIREEEDSPLDATLKLFERQIYNGHPYARPARGEPETVVALDREHVVEHHARWLRPDQLVLTCVGNFDREWLVSAWEEALGDWEVSPGLGVEEGMRPAPPAADRSAKRVRQGQGVWGILGYLAPPIGHPDYVPMKVLDCILGSSVDSRLFLQIRERRGLAYVVGTTCLERKDGGAFVAYWGTSPERQQATFSAVVQELTSVKEEAPAEDEVERAKKYLNGIFIIGQETNAGQASLISSFESLGLGFRYLERYPQELQTVSAEDVQRVAQKYLDHYVLAVTTPEK